MKAIKSNSDNDSDEQKKVARFFKKNRGATPSVAAPGVTHPSDATDLPLPLKILTDISGVGVQVLCLAAAPVVYEWWHVVWQCKTRPPYIATIEAFVHLQVQGAAASSGNSLHCYHSAFCYCYSFVFVFVFVLFCLVLYLCIPTVVQKT